MQRQPGRGNPNVAAKRARSYGLTGGEVPCRKMYRARVHPPRTKNTEHREHLVVCSRNSTAALTSLDKHHRREFL